MSVEIVFPVEFIVSGVPVSLQAKRPETRNAWKSRVREASLVVLPEGHFTSESPIGVTLFYFPAAPMQGDIDNIVKPILDALCRHVYNDDRQVERVLVQKFEPGRIVRFRQPSEQLANALAGVRPLIYIRLTDELTEGLP